MDSRIPGLDIRFIVAVIPRQTSSETRIAFPVSFKISTRLTTHQHILEDLLKILLNIFQLDLFNTVSSVSHFAFAQLPITLNYRQP